MICVWPPETIKAIAGKEINITWNDVIGMDEAKQEALEAALPKRFEGSVVTGLVYDSNILLASNSSPTSVSERGGYRGLLNIALDYRPLVQWDYDLGLQANYIDLKSVDLQGKASETLAMLDPRLMGASLPLRWRTQLWGQQQQIVLSAGTENLSLNSDGVGNRETIMSSTKASLETTFMLKEDHLTSLKLDWRDENALVSSELFSDATKMKITNSHVFFEDRKQRGDSVSVTMSYLNHMAKEDRFSYNRFAIGAGMVRSAFASTKWSHQLNLASTNRQLIRKIQEANIHWSSQWLSSITPSLQSSVGFGLESNLSTEEIFRYQKYTLSATLQWLTSM